MYKAEIDRFNKKIDEEKISLSAKRALHNIVEEFFSVDYQNISEKRKLEIEYNFKKNCLLGKSRCYRSDVDKVEGIFSQMENSLFTILDKSIDKSKSEKGNITEKMDESIIVQPNFYGIGIDLKKLFKK